MTDLIQSPVSKVSDSDLKSARLGSRFGRLDLISQLALLAVEPLASHFGAIKPSRIAICLTAQAGSLPTDMEYWDGRESAGGPSPTLFAYTLPSAAIGEIAIRHQLTGPNLCFVGDKELLRSEATDLIQRGEADGCVCVWCNVISLSLAELLHCSPKGEACAFFLRIRQPKFDNPACICIM